MAGAPIACEQRNSRRDNASKAEMRKGQCTRRYRSRRAGRAAVSHKIKPYLVPRSRKCGGSKLRVINGHARQSMFLNFEMHQAR